MSLQAKQRDVDRLTDEVDGLRRSKQQELERLNEHMKQKELQHNQKIQGMLHQFGEERKGFEATISDGKRKLVSMQKDAEVLQSRHADEIKRLKQQMEQQQREQSNLNNQTASQLNHVRQELRTVKQELTEAKKKREQLEERLRERTQERDEANLNIKMLNKEKMDQENAIVELNSQVTNLQRDLERERDRDRDDLE
eukprot:TRINITY_DN26846_c0_g1_i1.p1 TRINITY_DN26846_c0_g1~~TRINITY_DN26846_c0_g1_i1.p1  ORF type:complete len:211 (-),score=90.92 TRINITY_DN26846_c0_g1_i1:42-632(-)